MKIFFEKTALNFVFALILIFLWKTINFETALFFGLALIIAELSYIRSSLDKKEEKKVL